MSEEELKMANKEGMVFPKCYPLTRLVVLASILTTYYFVRAFIKKKNFLDRYVCMVTTLCGICGHWLPEKSSCGMEFLKIPKNNQAVFCGILAFSTIFSCDEKKFFVEFLIEIHFYEHLSLFGRQKGRSF